MWEWRPRTRKEWIEMLVVVTLFILFLTSLLLLQASLSGSFLLQSSPYE